MATNLVEVTDDEFAIEVLEESMPVLVDFYKDDCESCDLIAPVFKALAKEFDGQVKFVQAHAETCGAAMEEFGVEAFPVLQLFKDGEAIEEVPWNPGLPTEEEIRDFLNAHLEDGEGGEQSDEEEEEEEDEE